MKPNETPGQDLDDILSEFSSPTLEDILREFSTPQPAEEELPEPEPALSISDATAVFAPVETIAFTPPSTEEPPAEAVAPPPPQPPAEPFSENWEPEYEEPMGEFIPKEPIPFPPKSRLRQLRQKLVAGPERQFQALSETGTAQLQIGMFLNFLLAAISIALTVATSLGLLNPERLRAIVFCQFLLAMLAALVGCYRLLDGISNLFRGRFTLDVALLITFLACIADGLLCLSRQQLSCSSLFCLQVLFAQCAAFQRRNTELSQMDVLRKANELTAVVKIPDFHDERPGYISVEGEPEDFLDHYRKFSGPETALAVYTLISLLASAGLAVAAYRLLDLPTAIEVFMAAQLIALPFSAFVSMSRPNAVLQNRLHRLGTVLCGWQGIRAVHRRGVYPLTHEDLFPEGAIKMNNVKFHGMVDPGRVVSYTTALLTTETNGLLSVFRLMPRSRGSASHTVEAFEERPGGITGLVDGYRVFVGTADYMQSNGIQIPPDSTENFCIYTALEGQVCGEFAITIGRSKSTTAGIRTLNADRHFMPMLMACNFLLTPKFLRNKLAVNVRRIQFPDRDTRLALAQITPDDHSTVIALTTKAGLAPKAYALTGARAMRGALKWGAFIHILGGTIGLVAVGLLALNGGMDLLTPINLLLYSSIWSVPGFLITERTRYL